MLSIFAQEEATEKAKRGKSLELNETLATIAHLFAKTKSKGVSDLKSQRMNKREFYRIFGEAILLRYQAEGR